MPWPCIIKLPVNCFQKEEILGCSIFCIVTNLSILGAQSTWNSFMPHYFCYGFCNFCFIVFVLEKFVTYKYK